MPKPRIGEDTVVLKFGGGVHSRASEDEIDLRECSDGENFELDLQNRELQPRRGIELVGTAPNAGEVRGFISLVDSSGNERLAVQAGSAVYEINSSYDFTSIATVDATAQLYGRMEANWELDGKVLITDINLADVVMEWDGTTLQDITFTKNDGSTSFGTFGAKYCFVEDERAWFANVKDNGTAFPHLIVGSDREDFTIISNDIKPSSAIGAADAFFMLQPDLRAINGLVDSFNKIVLSSEHGSLYRVDGASAEDFSMTSLFPRSGAHGDLAIIYGGNDIIYGRQGRIESVAATEQFGDTEANDLSEDIADKLDCIDRWRLAYNQRTQKIYCFPEGTDEIWVLSKPVVGTGLSAWSRYTTNHSTTFEPTAIMNALDPNDGLEYVYIGDSSGRVFKLDSLTKGSDAGVSIKVERASGLFKTPSDMQAYDVEGWVLYRNVKEDLIINITFEFLGENIFNEKIQVTLDARADSWYWGGGMYWGGEFYFGAPIRAKLTRKIFGVAGQSNEFIVRVSIEGNQDYAINEIGLNFSASN